VPPAGSAGRAGAAGLGAPAGLAPALLTTIARTGAAGPAGPPASVQAVATSPRLSPRILTPRLIDERPSALFNAIGTSFASIVGTWKHFAQSSSS
jgi:hypothetical protein